MRKIAYLIIILLILPNVLAINLAVEPVNIQNIAIKGVDESAKFTYDITNNENSDHFQFYNLLGFLMQPSEKIYIPSGETKQITLSIIPRTDLNINGYYTLNYYIRGSDNSEQEEKLTLKYIDLNEAFIIGAEDINPESNSLSIYIYNKENMEFKNLNVKFKSKFFNLEKTMDLNPQERKNFTIQLEKDDFKKLTAGFYTLTTELTFKEVTKNTEGIIKFVEKDIVETETKNYGFIISTKTIKKENQGNAISPTETIVKKNIISRLFTSFSPEPDTVERKGMSIYYTWAKEIKPGETLSIKIITNWLYPLLIIFFIVSIIIFVKKYNETDVSIRKKVSFVKAKGGQFALKVSLFVSSKKYVERVSVIDRLPALMKVYNKFGGEKPSRIDEDSKLIEWDFEKLEAGEVRTLSYVIYSKNIGVMGKFALPPASIIYQKGAQIKETNSNRAFFITEQRKGDLED